MYWLEAIGLIVFIVLMTIGYKRRNRNIMLGASICLLITLVGPDAVSGFNEGYKSAISEQST
ncbi:hypothetical protein [Thalassotalea piscium]|uniref:Uncharacterized protein n=1 Tax=Thalassotalea piscium TaxID=1230533 RepID=A0A7X0TUT4_9GAMM|nr:hypothetical protein [Thalassotalea piscium]MBB6544543.1 hypothetical protein [Thalassotalea piscium]